jgi:hypothetical protein
MNSPLMTKANSVTLADHSSRYTNGGADNLMEFEEDHFTESVL